MKIPLDKLQQAPWYFRDTLGDDLKELGISIAERQEEPILLAKQDDGSYMVIDGWRRITAAKKAGVKELDYRLYKGEDPQLSALVMAHFDQSHDDFMMGGGLTDWLQKELDKVSVVNYGDLSKFSPTKEFPTPANFISSYRRGGYHEELNKAMGDPIGILERSFGSVHAIEAYLVTYTKAGDELKTQAREGKIPKTVIIELTRRLPKYPDLQSKAAKKCADEELGLREARKGAKVLKDARKRELKALRCPDEDLEKIILELDWSRPEEEIREIAGVVRAIRGRSSKADDFKKLPAVKELLNRIADFADWVYTGTKMIEIGKVSPEGRRFIANKLDGLIERLTKFKEELLWEGENGAQKQKSE